MSSENGLANNGSYPLRYAGEIEIPVAGGTAVLDSYAHTGWGSVPTHYLVDQAGRVQLITMQTVNWALSVLKRGREAPRRSGV